MSNPPSPPLKSHRRFNPLRKEWVLVSPHRATRPWSGAVEKVSPDSRPAYDPECYLCPGNKRANGAVNPRYESVYVFDNDFPALTAEGYAPRELRDSPSFIDFQPCRGVCRVICFSPRHDLTLADFDLPAIEKVIACWGDQYDTLSRGHALQHIMIFENNGAMMGASNPHPHGQLWATDYVPHWPLQTAINQEDYYNTHHRGLLLDYVNWEVEQNERVLWANEHFVVLVPWWAVWPFETLILPRVPVQTVNELSPAARASWAEALQRLLKTYRAVFDAPFPYSMGVFQLPLDGHLWNGFQMHQAFFPPLLRSAHIRKFMVGFELCAEPQRDMTPEQAAQRLREAQASVFDQGARNA